MSIDMRHKTRRQFLKTSGVVTGAGLLATAGAGQAAAQTTFPITWQFDTGNSIASVEAIDDDESTAYVTSEGAGELYKVDTSSGSEIWSISRSVSSNASIFFTLRNDQGYLSVDGVIYAIDPATGDERWQFQTGGSFVFPDFLNNSLYVENDTTLFSLDPQTGDEQWSVEPGAEFIDFAIRSGAIYVASDSRDVSRLDPADGTEVWSVNPFPQRPETGDASIEFVTDTAVYATVDNTLLKLEPDTGNELWSATTGTDGVEFADSRVIAEGDGEITAHDASTGTVDWTFQTAAPFASADFEDGRLYVQSGGSLSRVGISTGDEIWSFDLQSDFLTANVEENIIYVSNEAGELYGLDPATGNEQWNITVDERVFTFTFDGVAYVDDGPELLAIDPATGETIASRSFGADVEVNRFTTDIIYPHAGGVVYGLDISGIDTGGSNQPGGVVEQFDTNGTPGIQRGEIVDAIIEFNSPGASNPAIPEPSRSDIVDLIVNFRS
jgi:outer membrane protein assembly factor BamB